MTNSDLTIGDVLPSEEKDKYSENVLNVTLKEAMDIVVYDMPPTSNLTNEEVKEIHEIYQCYLETGGEDSGSDSAYWNKSPEGNQAYWDKN